MDENDIYEYECISMLYFMFFKVENIRIYGDIVHMYIFIRFLQMRYIF
jgi:hypothetical protein